MRIGGWLQRYPGLLERAYLITKWILERLAPVLARLGYEKVDRWLRWPEEVSKKAIFDCRMCGQCILHSTGMTCPMTCPKFIRNGPCGGVRSNGNCEVIPDMRCVWVEAYERSLKMPAYGQDMLKVQAPLNQRLEGTSAWVNMLQGNDQDYPTGWIRLSEIPVLNE